MHEKIVVGAPPAPWAEPLLNGLAAFPHVVVLRHPHHVLTTELKNNELDCALLPVTDAWTLPQTRAVPGIGVSLQKPASNLFLRIACTPPKHVVCPSSLEDAVSLVHLIIAEHFAPDSPISTIVSATPDNTNADAVVLDSVTEDDEDVCNLVSLWQSLTGTPLVRAIWLARPRTPLAELRRVLSLSLQYYENCGGTVSTGWRYRLGSDEMDGVCAMVQLAIAHGVCPPDGEIVFC